MRNHGSSNAAGFPPAEDRTAALASRSVFDFFSMKGRLADARSRAYANSDPGFREFELGLVALKDANQLGNSTEGRDTALLLYRAAIRLLVRATLLRRTPGSADMSWPETWSRATELPTWSAFVHSQERGEGSWLDQVVTNEQGEAYLSKLSSSERERVLVGMGRLARDLAAPLEKDATRVRRLLWTRRLLGILIALLVVVPLLLCVAIMTARPNLALHRPVVVSDRDSIFGVDPSRVVDGDRLNLGFHTSNRPNTTLTIDLGDVKPVVRVEVYNRPDFQSRATPLTVQVGTDGSDYGTVARQTQVFQHWTVSLPAGTRARFIRLVHESSDFFHLAEVEVY
jgi:hypothetical protein